MPREITTHHVDGLGTELKITAADNIIQGGACALYQLGFDGSANSLKIALPFQLSVNDRENPVTNEALLAVIADRLQSFQEGPLACQENATALTHCQYALMALHRRTRDRTQRGVSGTDLK